MQPSACTETEKEARLRHVRDAYRRGTKLSIALAILVPLLALLSDWLHTGGLTPFSIGMCALTPLAALYALWRFKKTVVLDA